MPHSDIQTIPLLHQAYSMWIDRATEHWVCTDDYVTDRDSVGHYVATTAVAYHQKEAVICSKCEIFDELLGC